MFDFRLLLDINKNISLAVQPHSDRTIIRENKLKIGFVLRVEVDDEE